MQKVQYRKVGSQESLWVLNTARPTAGSNTRPQWSQVDVTGGTIVTTPVQQGFHAPDTTLYRWMGGLAVDTGGNMALGYSTSNGTAPNFPSLAYAGRLATDPPGTLQQTETQLVAGGGSQIFTCGGGNCARWGDYSSMSVDPDGCTFWYTTEYYVNQTNGSSTPPVWSTLIGSFKFPSCTPFAAKHVVADFDGNGTTDVSVYRPSSGVWFVRNQSTVAWGASGDIPVPGDYDGNGTTDVAVFRPSSGVWFVRNQSTVAWGASTDIPLPLPNAIYRNFFS
jgi:hypothetical protein